MGLHELLSALTGLKDSGAGFTTAQLATQAGVPEPDVRQALSHVGGVRLGEDPLTGQSVMYLEENATIPKALRLRATNGNVYCRSVTPGSLLAEPEHKPLKPK